MLTRLNQKGSPSYWLRVVLVCFVAPVAVWAVSVWLSLRLAGSESVGLRVLGWAWFLVNMVPVGGIALWGLIWAAFLLAPRQKDRPGSDGPRRPGP